ncbi:hypothetical protein [Caballeronia sp. ATUFL_F2_KS9A]|uniref:hypothetical protein n=1 Tax=Caballeronia sp. ATUFL_F2_KS9A TaxID=2921777 RepID=UPI002027CD40|nr:hypothetical protein [Caballeronia sp. ATUFL_F2_KS9A]
MSTDGKMTPLVIDAVQLSRVRMDELLTRVGAGLPPDVRRELAAGLEAILVDAISQFSSHRPETDDFLSIAEAATQLFVSRPNISKLLEQGKLELHHETGVDRFITKASVLDYLAARDAAADAYQASASGEE